MLKAGWFSSAVVAAGVAAVSCWAGPEAEAPPTAGLPGFHQSPWFTEQVREQWLDGGVRVLANAPAQFDPRKPTRLVIYATPNGNTIEQTLGCATSAGLDWHFDIQHVAAQIRRLREVTEDENLVLACVEAEGLSWPAWKRQFADAPTRIRRLVEMLRTWLPAPAIRITLAGHSGGGSLLFGFIDGSPAIPDYIDRLVFLDANYGYSDADRHGDKLLAWLKDDRSRRLVVIAYDDRRILLDGKPVVGPDGGTFRATQRMQTRFATGNVLVESRNGEFTAHTGLDGRIALLIHSNPKNLILHTALVGEMNGLLRGLTDADAQPAWGEFGGPRAYTKSIQPAPGIPKRPVDAIGGTEFFRSLDRLTASEREEAIATELCRGNLPDFLRQFRKVTVTAQDTSGKAHVAILEVMPDYLAIGNDTDFVRAPMTPQMAARVAEAFGCALPTRKVVDEVYRAATVKLDPKPLTENRESPATFLQHNAIIEQQRVDQQLGELVAGIKKDVVVTNHLHEKPGRVAIYGWHTLDAKPIQPLTIVHGESYVDYSHGIRLMRRTVIVDGKSQDIRHVLHGPDLHNLLSDEGPILRPTY